MHRCLTPSYNNNSMGNKSVVKMCSRRTISVSISSMTESWRHFINGCCAKYTFLKKWAKPIRTGKGQFTLWQPWLMKTDARRLDEVEYVEFNKITQRVKNSNNNSRTQRGRHEPLWRRNRQQRVRWISKKNRRSTIARTSSYAFNGESPAARRRSPPRGCVCCRQQIAIG